MGTVVTTFQPDDLDKAESRWNDKLSKLVRKFHYTVNTNFHPDKKLMEFETSAYGKQAGQTTIDFEGD